MNSKHLLSRTSKDTDKKINKKRRAAGGLLLLGAVLGLANKSPDEIIYRMTTFILPVLTYETEFGEASRNYASSYEVPEWFYEDENMPENADLAAMESGGGKEVVTDSKIGDMESSGAEGENAAYAAGEDMTEEAGESADALAMIGNSSKGTVYTREQLSKPDFLKSKIFVIDSNTSMTESELDIANLLDTDLFLSDMTNLSEIPRLGSSSAGDTDDSSDKDETEIYDTSGLPYKVLIYHTHASESFADSRPGVVEDTVVGVGAYLTKLLNEQYGIPTYHDETTYDMIGGHLDRSKAYENSYEGISRILADNPSIEVVIDLHRDGVDEETHLVTEVNGKPTAKIMFLNGVSRSDLNGEIEYLQNPNKLMNLAFSFQLYLAGKEDYGDYVRKIYVRSLRYNLHVLQRAALIEAGAQNNTIAEEMNAMEPLAAMLDKVLRKRD